MKNTTITTNNTTKNTNNTTTAIKEGKTMKNTKNIRTKIIAATLTAITAISTITIPSSADDTLIRLSQLDALSETVAEAPAEDQVTGDPEDIAALYEDVLRSNPWYVAPAAETPAEEAAPAETKAPAAETPAEEAAPAETKAPATTNAPTEKKTYTPGSDIYEHPEQVEEEGFLSDEAKAMITKVIGGFVTAGIDTLGDAIPGGKFFSEPLKALVGGEFEGEDPAVAAINRLAEDNRKQYEDLKNRISNINDDINRYTKYIENVSKEEGEKASLGQMFRNMSSNLKDLSSVVKGIMSNTNTTPEEKLVLLANVNNGQDGTNYLSNVRQWADQISTTIGNDSKTALDIDLYGTLMGIAERKYVFAGEAHADAMESAQVLTEQYMYANTLLLQCQDAFNNLGGLTPEQVESLKANPEIYELYKKCTKAEAQSFQSDKQQETLDRIIGCIAGFQSFSDKEKEGNRYINHGTQKEAIVLDFNVKNVKVPNSDSFRAQNKNQYFNEKEMGEFVDYVRQSGMSIKEFLDKNNQTITGATNGKHCYLVIDAKLTGSMKKNEEESGFFTGTVDDYTQTIKVIDIYDPECKVVDLTVTTYKRVQHASYTDPYDIKSYGNDFIFIGAHKATDADNIKTPIILDDGAVIRGPKSLDVSAIPGPKTK